MTLYLCLVFTNNAVGLVPTSLDNCLTILLMSSIFSRNCSPTKIKRQSSDAEDNISRLKSIRLVSFRLTCIENVGISKELPNPKFKEKQYSKSVFRLDMSCHPRNSA